MRARARLGVLAAVACGSVLGPSAAAAEDSPALVCIAASERALSLRKASRLRDARSSLVACAAAACPAEVRLECEKQLDQVKGDIPTLVFEARDASGRDLAAVAVAVDGQLLAERLDGSALELDPGEHRFTFTTEGQPPLERSYVLRQGDKGRREAIAFEPPAPAASPPPAPEPAPVEAPVATASTARPPAPYWGPQRLGSVAVAGAGLAGVVVGSVFGLQALRESNDQKSACPSAGCASGAHAQAVTDHASASSAATVSTVVFAGAGAALAAGAVLWLTSPAAGRARTEGLRGVRVLPEVRPGGGALVLGGRF